MVYRCGGTGTELLWVESQLGPAAAVAVVVEIWLLVVSAPAPFLLLCRGGEERVWGIGLTTHGARNFKHVHQLLGLKCCYANVML